MKLSLFAEEILGKVKRLSMGEISRVVAEQGLVTGACVSQTWDVFCAPERRYQEIESRINQLSFDCKASASTRVKALEEATQLARETRDPYELNYLVKMFVHENTVQAEAAKNAALPEHAQRVMIALATSSIDRPSREVVLSLASNGSIKPRLLVDLLNFHVTSHAFPDKAVILGITRNIAARSRLKMDADGEECAQICLNLSKAIDNSIFKAALHGVRDPNRLAYIAEHHSPVCASDVLAVVAENPFTPVKSLEFLESLGTGAFNRAVGWEFPVRARQTLALLREQQLGSSASKRELDVSNSLDQIKPAPTRSELSM